MQKSRLHRVESGTILARINGASYQAEVRAISYDGALLRGQVPFTRGHLAKLEVTLGGNRIEVCADVTYVEGATAFVRLYGISGEALVKWNGLVRMASQTPASLSADTPTRTPPGEGTG